jgi:hypothetical protein
MPEDERAVAEAKAKGLAPTGASKSRARRLGWRPGCGSRVAEAGSRAQAGAEVRKMVSYLPLLIPAEAKFNL